MSRWCWLLLAVLLVPRAARAQAAADSTPYRKWESGAGLQLVFWPNEDPVVRTPAYIVDAGRFWSEHFETMAALTVNAAAATVDGKYTPFPGGGYQYESTVSQAAGLQVALAYQFYENVFAHPYIVGGAQMGWFVSQRWTERSSSYAPPVVERIGESIQARPFIGGGFKSYFDNGRAFMRSEFSLFVDPHGPPRGVIRIGAGVEF
jgi:hypothetical protein